MALSVDKQLVNNSIDDNNICFFDDTVPRYWYRVLCFIYYIFHNRRFEFMSSLCALPMNGKLYFTAQ